MNATEPSYAFANAAVAQRQRLRAIEAMLDEGTIRVLEARGISPGWRCLEVGSGAGSIASWLCTRVGSEGSVLATDLDVRFVAALGHPNLEARSHDLLRDELPDGEFDLVHLRLVVAWLDEPQVGLGRLVAALKPGACLVAEEMDFRSVAADPRLGSYASAMFSRVVAAHNSVLSSQHTFDPWYGCRLEGDLSDAGLVEVKSEGRAAMWRGGTPGGTAWLLTLVQLREALVASGLVTGSEVDYVIALCGDPRLSFLSQVTMAAWGYRA
ncbi:MAG: methyltransferase [Acidimicrobiales bacterium]